MDSLLVSVYFQLQTKAFLAWQLSATWDDADGGNCQCRKSSFPEEGKSRKEVHILGLCNSRAREDLHWDREIKC